MKLEDLLGKKFRAADPGAGGEGGVPAGGTDTDVGDDAGTVDSANDWGALSSDEGEGDGEGTPAAAPAVPVETPAATPPATEVKPPVVAEPPAQPQQQQQQPTSPATPEVPVDIAALRKNYETELTQYYALAPEDAQRLQTEPELVLPNLAAKVHLEVLDAVMAQLPQRVNMMLTHYTEATRREKEAEDAFFAPFPDLRDHKEAVLRVGQMYRAANPTATKEQAIKAIGDFVRQSLGLQAPAPQTPPQAPPVVPFTPAGSSGSGAPPAVKSEWDFIMQDDD